MSRRLIVNADDLGRTEGINRGIFAAHERGVVTSATMMVGFPAAGAAGAALARFPRLGVGLHVTLTGATPTLPAGDIPSLVDGEGRFARHPDALGALVPAEVRAEVGHQFELFRRVTGRLPTHLDSHHHSHRHPVILDALVEIAREHRLPIRRSSAAIGVRLAAEGLVTTDRFDEGFFGPTATLEVLSGILRDLGDGITELMCHPGFADDELRRTSAYADDRDREFAVLTHPEVAAAARGLGIELVHFGALCAS
ncbi:MAG: carbohydrate deacetylase [Acidobacteriota bacterium]